MTTTVIGRLADTFDCPGGCQGRHKLGDGFVVFTTGLHGPDGPVGDMAVLCGPCVARLVDARNASGH